jgi:hypothetical protein
MSQGERVLREDPLRVILGVFGVRAAQAMAQARARGQRLPRGTDNQPHVPELQHACDCGALSPRKLMRLCVRLRGPGRTWPAKYALSVKSSVWSSAKTIRFLTAAKGWSVAGARPLENQMVREVNHV